MPNDSSTATHVQVWAFPTTGAPRILGTIAVDRTSASTAYTVQADDDEATFETEMGAASWLADRATWPWAWVAVGRIFRPAAIGRPATRAGLENRDRIRATVSA